MAKAKFKDGIWRYLDEENIWRRYNDHAFVGNTPKKGWGSDGVMKEDNIHGEYFTTTNGTIVYTFKKD